MSWTWMPKHSTTGSAREVAARYEIVLQLQHMNLKLQLTIQVCEHLRFQVLTLSVTKSPHRTFAILEVMEAISIPCHNFSIHNF
jgi:hypothetical protein